MLFASKKTTTSFVLGLALGALSTAAAAQSFAMKEQGGVRWACAGVGADEREAFAKLESESNLKLVFAGGKRGAYLADVGVSLSDRAGKLAPVQFTADGPICLLQAPAGSYRLEASYGDVKRAAATVVGKDVKQPGTVVFRFPEEH